MPKWLTYTKTSGIPVVHSRYLEQTTIEQSSTTF